MDEGETGRVDVVVVVVGGELRVEGEDAEEAEEELTHTHTPTQVRGTCWMVGWARTLQAWKRANLRGA